MSDQRLSIRIPEDLQEQLVTLINATGKSESEIVREALTDYCRDHLASQTCFDIANAAGAIGCAKKLPADLSTNKRHLEGFGRE